MFARFHTAFYIFSSSGLEFLHLQNPNITCTKLYKKSIYLAECLVTYAQWQKVLYKCTITVFFFSTNDVCQPHQYLQRELIKPCLVTEIRKGAALSLRASHQSKVYNGVSKCVSIKYITRSFDVSEMSKCATDVKPWHIMHSLTYQNSQMLYTNITVNVKLLRFYLHGHSRICTGLRQAVSIQTLFFPNPPNLF